MSTDDPTSKLPEGEENYNTKPSMTAVLERINELGGKLEKQINDVAVEIRAEIMNLRADMEKGFRQIERQIGELSHDIVRLRADQPDLEERVDKIERKPS
jgi:hypothetical protein